MDLRHVTAVLVVGALLSGCGPVDRRDVTRTPQQTLERLRELYQPIDPTARLGLVTAVSAEHELALVREVETADFRENDVVTFIDGAQNVVTNGTVVRVTAESLHIRYDRPPPGRRTPRVGDIMIRFTQ